MRPMMYVRKPKLPPTKVPRIRSAPVCATFPMTCITGFEALSTCSRHIYQKHLLTISHIPTLWDFYGRDLRGASLVPRS